MNKILKLAALALLSCAASQAYAADAAPGKGDGPAFDMGITVIGATDSFDYGLTNTHHLPAYSINLNPTYGIFYGNIYAANIDYGVPDPKLETRFQIGATPTFGDFSLDMNVLRRMRLGNNADDRWVPYVTGTYAFNKNFSASVGGGAYLYDDAANFNTSELYLGSTITLDGGVSLAGEFYYDPYFTGGGNLPAYREYIATLTIPFLEKFTAVGKVGYESYDEPTKVSYTWYKASLSYAMTDHIALGVAYSGNNLDAAGCPSQAFTDCDSRIMASVTLTGKLSDLSK